MKNIFIKSTGLVLFLFLFQNFCFAKPYDTTYKANLYESNKSTVKISFYYDEKEKLFTGKFNVAIDGISIEDSIIDVVDFFESKVVDLDKSDDYKEIAVMNYFNDNTEYKLYRFNGKKIFSLGSIYSMDVPIIKGDGKVKATGWMGFWSYDYEYVLNEDKMKFEPVYKDEYPVKFYDGYDGEIVVKETFSTYKDRDIKSDVVTKFKVGDKIKILKSYTKVKCEHENNDFCSWYLIEDKDGKKGWLQLKDFNDKVSGIPWAG
jgi:hypothetical protein